MSIVSFYIIFMAHAGFYQGKKIINVLKNHISYIRFQAIYIYIYIFIKKTKKRCILHVESGEHLFIIYRDISLKNLKKMAWQHNLLHCIRFIWIILLLHFYFYIYTHKFNQYRFIKLVNFIFKFLQMHDVKVEICMF